MSIPLSERGISNGPESAVQEGTPIQELTKEDMRAIAHITRGRFVDDSKVYDFELGTVCYYPDSHHLVSLTLRRDPEKKDEQIIWVKGTGIDCIFTSACEVVTKKDSVIIRGKNSPTNLAIGQGKIRYIVPSNATSPDVHK